MSGHSTAPWEYVTQLSPSENHRGYRVFCGQGFFVADLSPRDQDGIEGRGNANLIAAAPDMLAILKALRTVLNLESALRPGYGWNDTVKEIDAVIAKAEGVQLEVQS